MDSDQSWYNSFYSTWAALTSGKLINVRRLDKHLKACKRKDSYSFNRRNRLLAVNFDQQLLSALTCNKKNPNYLHSREIKMLVIPKTMKAADCARWLGVAKITWVRSHIAGKTPRALRLGRLVLWDCEELERWLKAGMPTRVVWEAGNKRTKREQQS